MDEQACLGLRERKKIKARLAIERAALELVLERGYDGTTVEGICERAEVSKKTFFNYFPSKAAVVTGRVSEFPEAEQLVAMMEAHSEMCYLDVLVNMISADYTVREGDEMADLRFKMLRKMPSCSSAANATCSTCRKRSPRRWAPTSKHIPSAV